MRTEKIKEIIGDYLYNFWRNATHEHLKLARELLKKELETCIFDPKTQEKHVAEYELICYYLGENGTDLNFDKLKELRETYIKQNRRH